jgi:four helix bundle protein
MIQGFQNIILWQKAHKLVLLIYRLTGEFPKHEIFGLVSQMRRAVVSVASNFVEGYKRKRVKDSINFYIIAGGSLEELRYQLILSKDLNYINLSNFEESSKLCDEVGKLLYTWKMNQK